MNRPTISMIQPGSMTRRCLSSRRVMMTLGLAGMVGALATWQASREAVACMGTPPGPVCAKSTVLAKTVPVIVVGPGAGMVGGTVGISIISSAPPPAACVPVSTTISVTLVCVPTPLVPPSGSVTIPTPTAGAYSFSVPVTIPFPGFVSCLVSGIATTTWSDGTTTFDTGDTVLCVAEQAPGAPAGTPRLDMQLLTPAVRSAHPGDQRIHRYRLINNDPTETATLSLAADSEQTSRLPGIAPPPPPGSGVNSFAISDPGTGDNFPIAFADALLPDPPPGDNYILDDGASEGGIGFNRDASLIWLNHFTTTPGETFIDRISVAYFQVADGLPVSVLLYDDPNGDGNPIDAVLVARADSVTANAGTGIVNEVKIRPTNIGPPGGSFFVGLVLQNASSTAFPAALDESSSAGGSWIAADEPCQADVEDLASMQLRPALVDGLGFPGNWLLRAHGSAAPAQPMCVPLPADPMAFGIPTITRSITLCPGESRIVEIATRSWPMCADGSCSEQRVMVTGAFSDGSPTGACLGTILLAKTDVPPDFDCGGAGRMGAVSVQRPDAIRMVCPMPTHTVDSNLRVLNMQVQTGAPLQQFTEPSVLDPNRGRIIVNNDGVLGPAAQVGQPFNVNSVIEIRPRTPFIKTELVSLTLHSAAPGLNNTYFSIDTRSRVFPSTPAPIDSFFDVFYTVSLDGHVPGLPLSHRAARILAGSVQTQIIDPTHMSLSFGAVFDPDPLVPAPINRIAVVLDPGGVATGVFIPPPCSADLDGSGAVNGIDLGLMLGFWGPCQGCSEGQCLSDLDDDCDTDGIDLGTLLGFWGPCQPGQR